MASAAPATAPAPPPAAASAQLPIADFYADPDISGAEISPAGKSLAMIRHDGDAKGILVHDLASATSTIVYATKDPHTTIDWVRWKGDGRLIIGMTYLNYQVTPAGQVLAFNYGRWVAAMDPDGKNAVLLLKNEHGAGHLSRFMQLLDPLRGDPDHVLIMAIRPSDRFPVIWRTDIHTGLAQLVESGDANTLGWNTDRNGDVVARLESRGHDVAIQGRAPGEKAWSEVTRVRPTDIKALSDFELLGPASAPGTLYVAVKPQTPADGKARTARIYDFRTHTLGPPVWPARDYDISNIVTDDDNQLMGVCYWVDVYHCDFKDPERQANFEALDHYFNGDKSIAPLSHSDDARWWLFLVSGPNDPASYYLYDWKNKTMAALGSLYHGLTAEKLGSMERFVYTASDGMKIPAYVTRPPGAPKGPLPLVVIPHGGPEARDTFDYDRWSQFIATRGYLVLQPNFRGSDGYGLAFAEAGYRQWGERMQLDIVDGVQALIDSGAADPKRICIFGASYGGYAALMAGAQRPDLFKCVVSWAGVSDLEAFMKFKRGGLFVGERSPAYDYWVKDIGDPDADKERLARDSAVTYADKYAPPVLLIHGDADTNVPADQSREMERALKAAHHDVRLTLVKGEDHTDWDTDHEEAAIGQVVDFITAHIASAYPPPPATAPSKPVAASNAGAKLQVKP